MITGRCMVAAIALDAPADLEPVHAGHHDVEQHDVDPLGLQAGRAPPAAVGRQHLEVLGRQAGLEQLDVGEDVVDDENAGGHKAPSLR